MTLPFNRTDLERLFPESVWRKAEDLASAGAVVDVEMERDGKSIVGRVKGEKRTPFLTRVRIANGRGGRVRLTSTCTCLVYSECEHAAAALLGLLDRVAAPEPDDVVATLEPELEGWLAAVGAAARGANGHGGVNGHGGNGAAHGVAGGAEGECVLYFLEPAQRSYRDAGVAQPLSVSVARARLLPGGAYGREQPIALATIAAEEPPPFVRLEDQIVARLLLAGGAVSALAAAGAGGAPGGAANGAGATGGAGAAAGGAGGGGQGRRLSGAADGETLRRMLETGRCHWRGAQGQALRFGGPRPGRFAWRFDAEGAQRVTCEVEGGANGATAAGGANGAAAAETVVAALGRPWYVDLAAGAAGPVATEVPERLAAHLLRAPAVPATAAALVRQRLQPTAEQHLPLPEALKRRERADVRPVPVLHLHCPRVTVSRGQGWKREEQEVDCPLARVIFDYAGCEAGWQDGRPELNHVAGGRLMVMPRDTVFEVASVERLNALGLQPLGPTGLGRFAPDHCRQDFTFEEDDEDEDISMRWVEFNHVDLPRLQREGWRVTFDRDYPYRVAQPKGGWRLEIEDGGNDWFELDVGIEVDGERVPLLPILLDLFKRAPEEMTPAALARFGDEEHVYGQLPDGRLVPIPAVRLKAMLEALYELFADGRVHARGPLRLARSEATRLAALERALPEGSLQWSGGEQLRGMAQRLSDTGEIPLVPQPASLKATLRPYQQGGLSWLQFLSSCGLSGILADDMGLGKTLQALAHIVTEKQLGRLDRPCLIVAPTSLIPTWRNEVRRFAPHLSLLVLHGNDRRELFERIDGHDLVLTSYALLIRDRELLAHRTYRLVILDEAQAIKNPTTKLAKTAGQLKADQRLALTGTPIENHLGELWSVFNFLMPGFLGERESFRRVFRNPIEKEGDTGRRDLLAARVRPFMLRRTKGQVAAELPPKSEFLREIDLAESQRDLYESVRLAMHERVRAEIAARGLSQSSIAILEALLRLRQVCCDPRLLKGGDPHDPGAEPAASAKFELLMDMLPAMVETGRRIIVFSQFVEMLDLIDAALTEQGLTFAKLTGRTRDRETPVRRFQAGEVPIFLISLKAGGVGLTLTAADTVIHYDPWWNPAVEAQATDRAHRIGQDKTVFVYKLIASGTVEEKMVELQARKRALYEGVLGGSGGALAFSEEDIEALFAPLPTS